MVARIPIPTDRIADFCRRWQVQELSLFGSVIRPDFGEGSDVDVLVVFAPGAAWDFDHYDAMEAELRSVFGRDVDLVERRLIRNPFRRAHILSNRQVVYAAA